MGGNYPVGLPLDPPTAHLSSRDFWSYWNESHQIYTQCTWIHQSIYLLSHEQWGSSTF